MKSPYRALIREQARTAGVLCALLCGMSCVSLLALHYFHMRQDFSAADIRELGVALFLGYAGLGAVAFIVRQDVRGHLAWGFEPRLLRLPMSVNAVFSVVVSARFLALVTLVGLQLMLLLTLPGMTTAGHLFYMLIPLYLYLMAQALAWSMHRAPAIPFGLLALLVLMPMIHRLLGASPNQVFHLFSEMILHTRTLVLVPPLMLLVMYYGVYLDRLDSQFGPRSLSEVTERISPVVSPPLKQPVSALEAHLWYETRRVSWLLPVATLGITGFFLLLAVLVSDQPLDSGFGQYLPLAALVCAALGTGVKGMFPRTRMPNLRPVSNATLAAARLLAQLRGLLLGMAVAGALSLFLLLAGPVERQVLLSFVDEGPVIAFDVFILIMRPLVLATTVAWVALWLQSSPVMLVFVFLVGLVGTVSRVNALYPMHPQDPVNILFYGGIGIVFSLTLTMAVYVRLQRLASGRQVMGLFILFCLLASFVYFGGRTLAGIPGLLFAGAWAALLVAPVFSLTFSIAARRHDLLGWRVWI